MSWLHWATAALCLVSVVSFAIAGWQKRSRLYLVLMVCFLIVGALHAYMALPQSRRPQLDVKNVGATSALLRHDSEELVVSPGGTGHFRYSPGDSLIIFTGGTDAGKSKTVTLPPMEAQQRATGTPQRIAAEVNADNPEQIEFRCPK